MTRSASSCSAQQALLRGLTAILAERPIPEYVDCHSLRAPSDRRNQRPLLAPIETTQCRFPTQRVRARIAGLRPHQRNGLAATRISGAAGQFPIMLLEPPVEICGDPGVNRIINALHQIHLPYRGLCHHRRPNRSNRCLSALAGREAVGYFPIGTFMLPCTQPNTDLTTEPL